MKNIKRYILLKKLGEGENKHDFENLYYLCECKAIKKSLIYYRNKHT